eukprot:8275959-Ditylum_brightwellii.AAC.2
MTLKPGWRIGNLSPVLKPGDLSNPNKWQPVCLLETLYKGLASILACRINPLVRDHNFEAQYRSLNSKGCPDAALESLELVWKQEQIPVPLFRWFSTIKKSQ